MPILPGSSNVPAPLTSTSTYICPFAYLGEGAVFFFIYLSACLEILVRIIPRCRGAAFALLEATASEYSQNVERDTGFGAAGKCYALPGIPRTAEIGANSGVAGKCYALPTFRQTVERDSRPSSVNSLRLSPTRIL